MPDYGFNLNLGPQTKPTTLADMLNVAQGAQSLQKGTLEMNQAQTLFDEQKRMQQFMANPSNWQTDGRIDVDKINAEIPKIAPLSGAEAINKLTTLGESQTKAMEASQKLSKEQRSLLAGPMGVLGRRGEKDPQVYIQELEHIKQTHPRQKDLHNLIDVEINLLKGLKPGDAIPRAAIAGSQALLSPTEQQEALTPKVELKDTGGKLKEIITTRGVGGDMPGIYETGRGMDKTLAPGTEVIAGDNDPYGFPKGTKYILPTSAPKTATPPITSLAPQEKAPLEAQAGAVKGAAEVGVQDWQQTYKESKDANNTIASLQTIKKLVPDTFTGVGGERKKFLAGLAQSVGIPAYELETTKTDELMKNSKILQLAGGNTDAARQIAELANPNVKMTKDAIHNVVNQLIGMNKMKIARADYLAPFANNPEEYNRKSQLFNKFADYRLFQELTRQEAQKIRNSMSPAEREEMARKIKEAQMAGIIK